MYKDRTQNQVSNLATTLVECAPNTSGDLGCVHICNTTNAAQQVYVSLVPTGGSMSNANGWLAATIGASGLLSISEPQFMTQGDRLQASGTNAGLVATVSLIRYP